MPKFAFQSAITLICALLASKLKKRFAPVILLFTDLINGLNLHSR
jgi:hypothetical protein